MKPDPKRKLPQRPKARNKKACRRDKKIEVKLTDAEERMIRKKFGRMAAAAARAFWLGFKVANPLTPGKQATLDRALALHTYHLAVVDLRRRIKPHFGEEADIIMAAEEQLFQALTKTWLSNFSPPRK